MPLLSMFTPLGMLDLTSAPSHAEQIYTSLVSALQSKGAFDMSPGTRMEAWAYALSMALGRAQYALDRAGNQAHPLSAWDLIPLLEQAYLVVPSLPGETVADRAATLAAIDALQGGGRFGDIAGGLSALLGPAFLALVPTGTLSTTQWPASPGTGGGNWVSATTPFQFLQLIDPVSDTGFPQWVAYEQLDTSDQVTATWLAANTYAVGGAVIPASQATGYFYQCTTAGRTSSAEPTWPTTIGGTVTDGSVVWTCAATLVPALTVGQTVTVQGENSSVVENVVVTGVSLTQTATSSDVGYLADASQGPCFQATFQQPHDIGATIVTGPFPLWSSTQRQLIVVVTPAAAVDRDTRRAIDEYMRKPSRGVDTWAIVAATSTSVSGGTIGGVTVGYPMGTQTLGAWPFVGTP